MIILLLLQILIFLDCNNNKIVQDEWKYISDHFAIVVDIDFSGL